MRTTLDLDPIVLAAARSKARSEGISVGRAVSDLALQGLSGPVAPIPDGFPIVRGAAGHVLTDELVDQLRDDD